MKGLAGSTGILLTAVQPQDPAHEVGQLARAVGAIILILLELEEVYS